MSNPLELLNSGGFYVAKGLLDVTSVGRVLQSITKTFHDQLSEISLEVADGDLFAAMRALHRNNLDSYKRTAAALWRKLEVYQLAHDPNICAFLRERLGWEDIFVPGGQVVHIMANELKIPSGYFGQQPHQDFPSVQGSLDGVIVWIPLVTVNFDNFPLEVIPGSHRRGLLKTVEDGMGLHPEEFQGDDYVAFEVEPGDVVFMSVFLVHRSSVHGKSGSLRIAVSTRFDDGDEPTFVSRGYPTAYVRSVMRAPYEIGFPTRDQVCATFDGNLRQRRKCNLTLVR